MYKYVYICIKAKISQHRSRGLQEVEAPRIFRLPAEEVGRLSALLTGRLYPQADIWYSFLLEYKWTPGLYYTLYSAAGRIKSTKNQKDPIGNQIRYLPACNAVPQTTALLHTLPLPWCVCVCGGGGTFD